MKKALIISIATLCFAAYGAENCKDANMQGLGTMTYQDLKEQGRFEGVQTFESPAPAGLFEAYFDYVPDTICYDMQATYFTHSRSGKKYVMFTTHEDYCDGGNTYGLVVDMGIYRQMKLAESVVAEIGDGEFYCVE